MSGGKKVLVFAGTTEGGDVVAFLARAGAKVRACVATEYGRTSIADDPSVEVSSRPLSPEEMRALTREYPLVVDATHPYAQKISAHVREACGETGAEYVRLRRPSTFSGGSDVVEVDTVDGAVEYLKGTEGKILATTGSKEVEKYARIPGFEDRVFVRVLSVPESVEKCFACGFRGRNLFAMQGPFSEEMDYAMMTQIGARYLVTKDTGAAGGFDEKIAAARRGGATVVLVGRPADEPGMSYGECVAYLAERLGVDPSLARRRLSVVGTGVGPGTGLTSAGAEAVRNADLVVGAKRMLEIPEAEGKPRLKEYDPKRIFEHLALHPEYSDVAVLVSGDVGFYSLAKGIVSAAGDGYDVRLHCGISSVQYLCAKAGVPWQDVRLVSAHWRTANIVGEARRSGAVFALLNGAEGAREMCSKLEEYGLADAEVVVGCDLGYPEERVVRGSPAEVAASELGTLCAAVVLNRRPDRSSPISIPDSEFTRGDAPMTKSEIRALSVAKLKLSEDSVVYDVGAGTGSCSVEMARVAVEGIVYAIEKEEAALALIDANRHRMGAPNVEIVRGVAPEAMKDLPPPTHCFVGGSSGNLKEIVGCVLAKNPEARIVVNSVTLETAAEILALSKELPLEQEDVVCLNVASSRRLGRYNLMTAQNPVYIAVFKGRPE